MGVNEDYLQLDATDLAGLVQRRDVTPAEMVEVAIARLARSEPKLTGMMERAFDRAREEASQPLQGPFAGVPFLLKDNMHVASGIPYHNGSRIWRGWAPPRDSELVRRFRAAGLIVLGTTKVPELSLTPVTEPKSFGRVHNPWALDRTAGGFRRLGSARSRADRSDGP
jgi:amidase